MLIAPPGQASPATLCAGSPGRSETGSSPAPCSVNMFTSPHTPSVVPVGSTPRARRPRRAGRSSGASCRRQRPLPESPGAVLAVLHTAGSGHHEDGDSPVASSHLISLLADEAASAFCLVQNKRPSPRWHRASPASHRSVPGREAFANPGVAAHPASPNDPQRRPQDVTVP